jgi:hypothetical protein
MRILAHTRTRTRMPHTRAFLGYMWITANTILYAVNMVYEKFAVMEVDQTPAGRCDQTPMCVCDHTPMCVCVRSLCVMCGFVCGFVYGFVSGFVCGFVCVCVCVCVCGVLFVVLCGCVCVCTVARGFTDRDP